ncbi:MAG: GNAT family N-acetyltransferase [Anaerolineae bacterium]
MPHYDFSTFPTLETERLRLRRITTDDRDAWLAVLADPNVTRYLSDVQEPFSTSEMIDPLLNWADAIFNEKTGIRWAITRQNNPTLIGTCGFHKLSQSNRHAEIGYELHSNYWRQGIMSEALKALIRFCFDELDLHRLYADVTEGNQASAGILLRLGFSQEGTWREAVWKETQFRDLWLFGLLRHEYQS